MIEIARDLETGAASKRPDYWFLLAAAFGQKHSYAATEDKRREARAGALRAVRQAVALDATYKRRLWELADQAAFDNDLADFREDDEFLSLVGRPQRKG